MAKQNSKYSVSGTITDANGFPVGDNKVELLLLELRTEKTVGQAQTDADGAYHIAYIPPAGRVVVDLRIRALDSGGQVLAVSAVQYRAPLSAVINLVLPAADSQENGAMQLVNRLKAAAGNVNLADLREDKDLRDISTLTAATGEPPVRIARLSVAHQLAVVSKIAVDVHFAWLEAGFPENLDLLVTLPSEHLKSALENAAAQGILDQKDSDYWDKTVQKLKRANIPQPLGLLAASNLYQPVSAIQTGEADYIKRVLDQNLRRIILENLPEISPATRQQIEARISGKDIWDNPEEELGSVIFRSIAPTPPPGGTQWPPKGIGPDPCKINQMAFSRSKVRDVLQLDTPLQYHPFFAEPLRRVKTFEYAKLVSVTNSKAIALLEQGMHADEWSEDTLQTAVAAQIVTQTETKKLSRLGTLSRLAGHNPGLVTLLHQNAPDDLTKLVDDTTWDWQVLIDRNQNMLPPGETSATFAEKMGTKIELAYPVPYFLHHRLKAEPTGSPLALFHKNNPSEAWLRHDWLQGDHAEFKWTGIAQAKREQSFGHLQPISAFFG
ncbi:MAG: carboxypeptidase regulatory-like domain-containing protein [Saprospirales bacterium]|nr:carboxypeptidase regulatory-like domain-containing protein [Saprospirales bacterium]